MEQYPSSWLTTIMGAQVFHCILRKLRGSLSYALPLLCLPLLLLAGTRTALADDATIQTVSIGAIIDESTRIGKEHKVAMNIAVAKFNSVSNDLKLLLRFANSSRDPFQSASSAVELAKENEAQAIIGMETWQEAALVAQVGNLYRLPVLSLATAPATQPSAQERWPYLVQMARSYSDQLSSISAIVRYYHWPKVIAVYEDDGYAGMTSMLNLLSQYLQQIGSEVEYRVALPPLDSMADPKGVVLDQLVKVLSRESRVFIVLQTSAPLAVHLFREAKNMGLIGRDEVWITTESISSILDSVNSTVISSMQGVIGIKTYYPETSKEFQNFYYSFWTEFRAEFPEELNSQPGIYAIRAYDAIKTVVTALKQVKNKTVSSENLLQSIQSTKFSGLTGEISFEEGEPSGDARVYTVINVVGKSYKELSFWSSQLGFFESVAENGGRSANIGISAALFPGLVNWPGDVKDVPRGWGMPTNAKPLKIGVPGRTSFEKFVKVETTGDPPQTTYSGYCIDLFLEVMKVLEESYTFAYEFEAFYGTYDELVDCVYNKTFDAVVGDVTISANRSEHVEFTQPYAKSGLGIIVPFKSKEYRKAWLFAKPFTWSLWLISAGMLLCTIITVWVLEKGSNPGFRDSPKDQNQILAAMWFILSSIFLTQKEKIHSNYTRVVVIVWLFVVFVLTQSYTANLTSMLTVPLLEPKIKDIAWLKENNKLVGCDGDSFIWDYLINVLGFETANIMNVSSQFNYPDLLNKGNISAAFLELPYERVFLNQYCNSFTQINQFYRFEGLGFVFQKGSPLAADVSKAILQLSEKGVLTALEQKWFAPSPECLSSSTNSDVEPLDIGGFWFLYLLSGVISTICFLVFLIRLIKNYKEANRTPTIRMKKSIKDKLIRFWKYFEEVDTAQPDVAGLADAR
ncbi:hypothetical protein Droror1_Dr00010279 [Drosera rotundifolia]